MPRHHHHTCAVCGSVRWQQNGADCIAVCVVCGRRCITGVAPVAAICAITVPRITVKRPAAHKTHKTHRQHARRSCRVSVNKRYCCRKCAYMMGAKDCHIFTTRHRTSARAMVQVVVKCPLANNVYQTLLYNTIHICIVRVGCWCQLSHSDLLLSLLSSWLSQRNLV